MDYKVGDKIKITKVFNDPENTQVFFEGDVGIIIADKDRAGDYLVDFNNQGNPKVIDGGIWYVGEDSDNRRVKAEFILLSSLYIKGDKILVSADNFLYEENIFHSYEHEGVWCYFNDSDKILKFWLFHKKLETKKVETSKRFHEAQVGDLVYNRLYGYHTIDKIVPTDDYPLKVCTHGVIQHSFDLKGRIMEYDSEPTWFYVNPKDHDDKYLEERPNGAYERKKPVGVQSSIEWVRENLSNRANEWLRFSDLMVSHIESYTVPQYKDAPEDQAEGWTAEDCFKAIERYLNRRNSQSREGQELLDIKKMAHYLCLAYFKKEAGK